jgi:hypothetical protein
MACCVAAAACTTLLALLPVSALCCLCGQVASVEALPDVSLGTVRGVSSVAHCILEWVLALHGYYWAHRAMAPLIDATALLKELSHDFASQCDMAAA